VGIIAFLVFLLAVYSLFRSLYWGIMSYHAIAETPNSPPQGSDILSSMHRDYVQIVREKHSILKLFENLPFQGKKD
jgi:hypothetical protein